MKEKLMSIVKELKEVARTELDNLSDDCLFENAVKLYISNNIQEDKKENNMEKATVKQRYLLSKMGYTQDLDKLSKQEAYQIIKKLKGGYNER